MYVCVCVCVIFFSECVWYSEQNFAEIETL